MTYFAQWLLMVTVAALAGCGGGGGAAGTGNAGIAAGGTTAMGTMNTADSPWVAPAAAPVAVAQDSCDIQHVYVTVERVRVLRIVNAKHVWTDLTPDQPRRIDLLAAGGGVLRQLGLPRLSPWNYEELRLVLAPERSLNVANAIQTTDGTTFPLRVPSGEQTGIRLGGDLFVTQGDSADFWLVLSDVCDALMRVGNPSEPTYQLRRDTLSVVLSLETRPPAPPETMLPLPGGAMFVPTLAPGFIVTVIDAAFPLQVYGGDGQLASQVQVPFLVNEADTPHGRLVQLASGGFAGVSLGGPLTTCIEWYANPPGGPVPCMQNVTTQAFTAAGVPIGAPVQLGLSVPYNVPHLPPAWPAIAPLVGGGYVVAWQQSTAAGVNEGVWVRRFDAQGAPLGVALRAWTDGTGFLRVVGLSTGGYAVVGNGKVAAFSASDALLWQAAPAASFYPSVAQPLDWRGEASLAALPGGGLVIAWNNNGFTSVVQYDAAGTLVAGGSGTTVDDSTPGAPQHTDAVVLALPDGGYVVAWVENLMVMARRFAANGSPAGPATRVDVVSNVVSGPTAAALRADGGFMLSWGGTVSVSGGRVEQWVRQFPANALLAAPT